jgi:hypothetical protein
MNNEPAFESRQDLRARMNGSANLFKIPEENIAALQLKIAKLSKKALKLGSTPITMTVGAFVDVPEMVNGKATGMVRRVFDVVVEGPTPRLNGWSFAATLERMEGEVMVRSTPSLATQLPTHYRNHATAGDCDHCKQNRRRAETFVLLHDDGRFVQVGRQCLSDFLGGANPQSEASMAELLWDACDDAEAAEESGSGGGSGGDRVDTVVWLAHVAAAIRVNGWMSKSKAQAINEGLLQD